MRYYILDYGKDLIEYAQELSEKIRKDGHHLIEYFTDADGLMCLEELTEDEFLDHFKKVKDAFTNPST
jgi:hypothetical protein